MKNARESAKAVAKKLPAAIGAAGGGAAGTLLGAEFGLLGAALGGAIGYALQEGGAALSDYDYAKHGKLAPMLVGTIPTDITNFVGRSDVLDKMGLFLERSGSGVCTLHGLGGCGKSATLQHFIRSRKLLAAPSDKVAPDAVFCWSFSQDDDLEHFFEQLQAYLQPLFTAANRGIAGDATSPLMLPERIHRSGKRIVVMLDGLERVIHDGPSKHSKPGAIAAPALRALLQRAAENECGSLKIFVTTRLLIPDINLSTSVRTQVHDLNLLASPDCVSLLRRLRVRGSRQLLLVAANEYRQHAYSVSLLGKALVASFRGDIRRRDRLMADGRLTELPLSQLLRWYETTLSQRAMTFLKAACLFRASVPIRAIAGVMQSVLAVEATESTTPAGSTNDIAISIAQLRELGLIFTSSYEFSLSVECDLHPLVREYFHQLLLNPAVLHIRAGEILAADAPEAQPTDSASIGRLIELIYHALKAGQKKEAWSIYRQRLGGYPHLGYNRADHPTGSKAIYMFLDSDSATPTDIGEEGIFDLFTDGALYLKNEGRLDDAIDLLQSADAKLDALKYGTDRYASTLLVRSGIEFLRGRWTEAITSIDKGERDFIRVRHRLDSDTALRVEKECLSRRATVLAARNDARAESLFRAAMSLSERDDTLPHDYAPLRYAWLQSLTGRGTAALELLSRDGDRLTRLGARMLVHRVSAMKAFAAISAQKWDLAAEHLDSISEWATKADLHMFVQSWQLRSLLAAATGSYQEAMAIGSQGLRHAGENGFAIEWHDINLCMARAAFGNRKYPEARAHCDNIISGSEKDYACAIEGAYSPQLNYVWAAVPARYLLAQIDSQEKTKPTAVTNATTLEMWALLMEQQHYLTTMLPPPTSTA